MLLWACWNGGHLELTGALLERGADVHAKNLHGYDACYWACCSGNLPFVALLLLLDESVSPYARPPNNHSYISIAAVFDHPPFVLPLIYNGANLM